MMGQLDQESLALFLRVCLSVFIPPRHGVLSSSPGTVSARSHGSNGSGAREMQGRRKEPHERRKQAI